MGLSGGFQWRAEGDQNGKRFGNRKVKLAMPNKKQLRAYVDEYVTPQLRNIKASNVEEADKHSDKRALQDFRYLSPEFSWFMGQAPIVYSCVFYLRGIRYLRH